METNCLFIFGVVPLALMNVAYNDGDMTWELIWKDSRLRCIEGAETLTYNVSGKTKDINARKI